MTPVIQLWITLTCPGFLLPAVQYQVPAGRGALAVKCLKQGHTNFILNRELV